MTTSTDRLLALLTFALVLASCNSSNQPIYETSSQSASLTPAGSPTKSRKPVQLQLLAELDSFRQSASFAQYGFAEGGPHHVWLDRLEAARQQDGISFATKVSLGELMSLGQEYRSSSGRETADTAWFRRRVLDPLGND